MVKYMFFLTVFIYFETMTMDFNSIVQENAGNPKELIEKLRSIREFSIEADAFLQNFGGVDYQKESDFVKEYSSKVTDQIKEAAFIVGNEMRKIGGQKTDEVKDLLISKRFLEFALRGTGSFHFHDQDVSPSFLLDQLDGMLAIRYDYIKALEALKNRKKENFTPVDRCQFSEEMLNDL